MNVLCINPPKMISRELRLAYVRFGRADRLGRELRPPHLEHRTCRVLQVSQGAVRLALAQVAR